jgi:hypothetical protein
LFLFFRLVWGKWRRRVGREEEEEEEERGKREEGRARREDGTGNTEIEEKREKEGHTLFLLSSSFSGTSPLGSIGCRKKIKSCVPGI